MMKKTYRHAIIFLLMAVCACNRNLKTNSETAHRYYVSADGADTNDGSMEHPWKTIDKLNTIALQAGDHIYLRGGDVFESTIAIDSSEKGRDDAPIVFTAYGNGRPLIASKNEEGLKAYKTSFVTIKNISFKGAGRKEGNTKSGVNILYSDHIKMDNLDISGYQKSGLLVFASKNILVENSKAHDNGFAGICVEAEYLHRESRDIIIRKCTTDNNPGDPTNFTNHSGNGILVGNCSKVLIDYCSATNNGWDMPRVGNGPVGIWAYEADSVIIQHCISYNNKTSKGSSDGGGFDFDGGVSNSILQYCLSYGNQGGGFGIFQYTGASKWTNNTIRYCVSENDGMGSTAKAGAYIWNSTRDSAQFSKLFFYNNVIYNDQGAAISYAKECEHKEFYFINNIFVSKGDAFYNWQYERGGSTFLGNNWWSLDDRFSADGINSLAIWSARYKKEMIADTLIGFNIDPAFPAAGKTRLSDPGQLINFSDYQSAMPKGIDAQKMFGINNGGKDINGKAAVPAGIGASFK